jgi:DNA-binding NarL/FixJ family response regulator
MTASGVRTTCLIADDQAMVWEGFGALLAAQPDLLVVGQAADGAEAVAQARQVKPDIILMDVRMPVMDGLEATRQILAAPAGAPVPRVLMLTTFDLDDAPAAELVHAVRVVAAGDALLAPSVTRRLIADFARRPRQDPPPPASLRALTPRETEVLKLIARGLSNAEISSTLVIAEQTTKTHVGRILAKLDLRDRAQAVVLAYESGLVAPGQWPLMLSDNKTLNDLGVASYRSADDLWVTPAIGSMSTGLHPILALWGVLLALSSLARYEPATWSKMIDIDRSAEANAIEHLLEEGTDSVPATVLHLLTRSR